MKHIKCRNHHWMTPAALFAARQSKSLIMEIEHPREMLVFWPQLNINPFDVFREGLSLIASVQDPSYPEPSVGVTYDALPDRKLDLTLVENEGLVERIVTPYLMLQQFVAAALGGDVNCFWRAILHARSETTFTSEMKDPPAIVGIDPYDRMVTPMPMVTSDPMRWQEEIKMLLACGTKAMGYTDPWIRRVALPILQAYDIFNNGGDQDTLRARASAAIECLSRCAATDWQFACDQWIVKGMGAA